MCSLLNEQGVDATPLLDVAGVQSHELDDPTTCISGQSELAAIRLFRQLAVQLPGLAVQIGRRYRLATFGSLGMAMLSAPTLADSLRTAMQYQRLSFSWLQFDLELGSDQVRVYLDAREVPLDLRDFLLCRDVTAACAMLRDLAGDEIRFTQVSLNLSDISQADQLATYLRCPLHIGGQRACAEIPLSLLERINRHHSVTAHALCLAACEAQLAAAQAMSVSQQSRDASVRVASMLQRHPGRLLPHEEVASMLGASERTLRRRLAREGTSFRDVRERVLRARAEQLLSATSLSVAAVAEQLGFADASTFCQAFRRWAGQTPSAFRRAAKREEVPYHVSSTN
ncbi:MAG TPA: AraC family transcriptional regulator ligand-binding domain-containing protein [Aquabacterium sp.]|nr:AraC family transcriptional regulator ligand-binding domain-containing protein [Aquabacterium sp.]